MRRSDREVRQWKEILAIMEKCDVCRIALNNNGYPYILPLNFGMEEKDGKIELYFHGAMEGTKYDLMERDPRASFEMDCGHRLVTEPEKGSCTMEYESVIGQGRMEPVGDEEREHALQVLMKHYYKGAFPLSGPVMSHTRVFKLTVEELTAKRRMKKTE